MTSGLSRYTRPFALCSAVAMLVGSGAVAHADGIPRGGSCCADLEERVAELEATTARKGNRKVSLTISGQVATSVMAWNAGARADTVTPGQAADGGNQGTLNTLGNSSDTYIVDNTFSGGTFFEFAGTAKVSPNLTAGFQLTTAICSGSRSHNVTQANDDVSKPGPGSTLDTGDPTGCFDGRGDATMVVTRANWFLDHKSIGRITVGRQDTSTAGITGVDLGGAGVVANANIGYWQGGFLLTTTDPNIINPVSATWNTALGGSAVSGSGLSRGNFVKYTSPVVGGFSVQAARGEDDIWDAALRYAGEWHGFRIAAGVGYIYNQGGANEVGKDHGVQPVAPVVANQSGCAPNSATTGDAPCEISQWKGSASILHIGTGLFATAAFVDQDNGVASRPNTVLWYGQAGISKNWTGLGSTVLYGEYAQVNDPFTCNSTNCAVQFGGVSGDSISSSQSRVWGLGIVQHIDAAAMELFLSYRRYSFDATSPAGGELEGALNFQDFDVIMSGARIRF